jgi:hypothetical protein
VHEVLCLCRDRGPGGAGPRALAPLGGGGRRARARRAAPPSEPRPPASNVDKLALAGAAAAPCACAAAVQRRRRRPAGAARRGLSRHSRGERKYSDLAPRRAGRGRAPWSPPAAPSHGAGGHAREGPRRPGARAGGSLGLRRGGGAMVGASAACIARRRPASGFARLPSAPKRARRRAYFRPLSCIERQAQGREARAGAQCKSGTKAERGCVARYSGRRWSRGGKGCVRGDARETGVAEARAHARATAAHITKLPPYGARRGATPDAWPAGGARSGGLLGRGRGRAGAGLARLLGCEGCRDAVHGE